MVTKSESADLVVVSVDPKLRAVVDEALAGTLIAEPGLFPEDDSRTPAEIVQELAELLAPYSGSSARIVADVVVVRVNEEWLMCGDIRLLTSDVLPEGSPMATSH